MAVTRSTKTLAKRLHTELNYEYPEGYKRRSKKRKKSVDEPMEIGRGFFRLPAELRIAIYEYVLPLHEMIYISVNELTCVPALLLVCGQIRREARDIWYKGNFFCMATENCDSSLSVAWTRHCRALNLHDINVEVAITGDPNWTNVMTWCKAVFDEGALLADLPDNAERIFDHFGMQASVAVALRVAQRCRNNSLTWSECEAMVTDLRYAFGGYDQRWWK
ncbi:hypothetical protein LTR56_016051 [Elasticomyces elasticus]|nr:hypothetical protein LTR56_016051 [Elasticomyces elasticus]KAK3642497.1 hypothetical protein LTR22_016131 [Elasticomyces elasticus]KAK4926980.1 hypothetical protein LTR49_006137 [Elasticomyces elasticus]KAK5764308.1 hypothetical protein LTS12_005521 [Elasticomyces elasticus]